MFIYRIGFFCKQCAIILRIFLWDTVSYNRTYTEMAAVEHQYINRIFAILDCFSVEKPELGVREAARMLNISPSSCGRMLSELRDEGILTQDSDTRAYSLGGRVIRIQ